VWLASSLVAYTNGPTSLAVFSGILLFPLIPIIWDLWGQRKRKSPGFLTWGDRLTLRTLALNLIFIACLLAFRPQTAFLALSTRGDWMLDGRHGQSVELVRQGLFKLANGLEWLYLAVRQNPYRQYADTTHIRPSPEPQVSSKPSPEPQVSSNPSPEPQVSSNPSPQPQVSTKPSPQPQVSTKSVQKPTLNPQISTYWPWQETKLHPAVANMPVSVETSIESVAKYIAQQEKDPFLRIKALHDYVADRIAYDAPSYFARQYPPQDAETVFTRHTAVCAGYAKLLEALGQAIGEEIVYVVGDSRSQTSDLSGSGHAWNAAKIAGNWYLIDATWDSGYVDSSGFTKRYTTDYLFPPPAVMTVSHFPEDPAWQLLPKPLSRGEFLRQPMMSTRFFAEGFRLISPTRSQTDIQGDATIELKNPQQRWLMASYGAKGSGQTQNCMKQTTQGDQISCPLPGSGTYEVSLFSGDQQYGRYAYIGRVEFNKK